jgi:MOSC domain-containing protein YiiM
MDALRDRGGICADVIEAGTVEVGDPVELEPLADRSVDADGLAAAIRERADGT